MTFLRAIPGWCWLVLLVAGGFLVQEWRIQSALSAAHAAREAQFNAAIQAIEGQRQEQKRAVGTLNAERAQLKADLAQHASRLAVLDRRTAAASANVERTGQEAERLVTGGSMADVVKAWEALGWKLVPAPRPRP